MKKWILVFAVAIIAVLLLRGFVFIPYTIPSMGMENALYPGDRIIVNKWSYGLRTPLMSLFSYHRWNARQPQHGDIAVFNNPIPSRKALDRREVFIGRCVGNPGDTLLLDTLFNAISGWARTGPDRKNLYSYPRSQEAVMDSLLRLLSIDNNYLMGGNEQEHMRSFSRYEYYLIDQVLGQNNWVKFIEFRNSNMVRHLIVPKAGQTVEFDDWNLTLFRNTILLHEGKKTEIINDSLYVEGVPANNYTFTRNYYWMMSNNSVNMADSRLFGFVPEENLIGKASFIWLSKEPCTGLFKGYRWERMMRPVKQ